MTTKRTPTRGLGRALLAAALALLIGPTGARAAEAALRQALTFHASFDGGTEADFAQGDKRLYHATALNKRAEATVGLPAGSPVTLAPGQGRFGGALRFKEKSDATVFYQVVKNMDYRPTNWSGTVSFWLSLDPAAELSPGFCDPLHITPRAWDDGAFFVEFEKRKESVPFRLGAYPDFKVWNPLKRNWGEMAPAEKPLVAVEKPPFARGKWTHVVFSFENYNTGRPDGVAQLYLDGKPAGTISARRQTFTWDQEKSHIMIGLTYVGLFDDLAIFNRALGAEEVALLNRLPNGVGGLTK